MAPFSLGTPDFARASQRAAHAKAVRPKRRSRKGGLPTARFKSERQMGRSASSAHDLRLSREAQSQNPAQSRPGSSLATCMDCDVEIES